MPWRPGATGAEQARIAARRAANRPRKAPGPSKKDLEKVIKTKRQQLFRDLKRGKITPKEYRKAIRKLH